jgi:hypothetical protein
MRKFLSKMLGISPAEALIDVKRRVRPHCLYGERLGYNHE